MAEPKRINRSVYGQYGLAQIEGYEVPYLSAKKAEELVSTYGDVISDFSHGRGSYTSDLGWSSNSFTGKLARGAAAFGIEKKQLPAQYEYLDPLSIGYTGVPSKTDYQITGDLVGVAKKFGIDTENIQPKTEVVKGDLYSPTESGWNVYGYGEIKRPTRDLDGNIIGYEPLTRTVTVEEQLYDKINEATKDYYAYTGDTLIPGEASEGGGRSFQTVLYKKEGDILKPITAPVSHGGMQNADVYTGGGGFKLSELIRGVAPVAAFAIGAPFLDAALAGSTAAASAATQAQTGNAMLASLGLGAEASLPYTAAAGLPANLFTVAPAASGFVGLTPEFATELGLSGGSGLSTAGASGNVLAGIPIASEGFVGLTPEYAAELGLEGGSGLSTAGTPGNVLSGVYGAGEGAAFGMSDKLASELGLSGGSGLDTAGAAGDPLAGIYGASKPLITPGMAIQGARLGMGLLSGGQQQQQQAAQMPRQNIMPRGQGVDYSGIYNLLNLQRQQNPNSLLG